MTVLALLLAASGFLALGATTDAHHRRVTGAPPTPLRRRWARCSGWALLTASLPISLAAHGSVYGPIWWLALLMLAAGLVFLGLNLAPLDRLKTRDKR